MEQQERHPHNPELPASYGKLLLGWESPEHEPFELGPRSRRYGTAILIVIIAYALFTNSPLMAITFILIGIIIYLFQHHEPRTLFYGITTRGVVSGDHFYAFDDIESYYIFSEPPFEDILSLHIRGAFLTHAHVPLLDVTHEQINRALYEYIPEQVHEPHLVDTLEKFLHT
ncbi:MAG: hypothetical protein AAB519_04110 [Patescibacteria group bacterium]